MNAVAIKDFKSKLSEYIKQLSDTSEPLFITKHGKIVAKVIPCDDASAWEEIRKEMAGSVKKYDDPTEPVGLEDWEMLP